jgi:amino acid transporter
MPAPRDSHAGPLDGSATRSRTPALGLRDVVFFVVASGTSLRWLPIAATAGKSSLLVWIGAALCFQLPLALAAIELSGRYPGEGGLYRWSREAFGERAGFLSGWLYWASNVPYFPSLLYFAAGNLLFVGGPALRALDGSPLYYVAFALGVLLLVTWLNVLGLHRSRWLTNLGAVGTWLPVLLLGALALTAALKGGSATDFARGSWLPPHGLRDLALWSVIALGFAGIETATFIAADVRDAPRTLPRGIAIGGVLVVTTYLLGTIAVLVLLPSAEVSGLAGIMQAIERGAARAGAPWLVPGFAALIALASIGALSAWFTTAARVALSGGMEGHLPARFGRLHPTHGTPTAALWLMFGCAGVLAVLGQAGQTVRGAYDVLVAMTTIATFIPYLYVFAALIVVQKQPAPEGTVRVPGGPWAARLAGGVGFIVTLMTVGFALLPAPGETRPVLAVAKVVGLTMVLVVTGMLLARRKGG